MLDSAACFIQKSLKGIQLIFSDGLVAINEVV